MSLARQGPPERVTSLVLVGDEERHCTRNPALELSPSGTVSASLRDMTISVPLAAVMAPDFTESPAVHLRRTSWFSPATAYLPVLGLVLSGYWALNRKGGARAVRAPVELSGSR